jgi:ATP-dependent helicase YprA (DUF1998 family)
MDQNFALLCNDHSERMRAIENLCRQLVVSDEKQEGRHLDLCNRLDHIEEGMVLVTDKIDSHKASIQDLLQDQIARKNRSKRIKKIFLPALAAGVTAIVVGAVSKFGTLLGILGTPAP